MVKNLSFALILIGAIDTVGQAQINDFSVTVTATQAMMRYTAPDENSCFLQVSESPALGPVVPDVDPSLFQDAQADHRQGNVFLRTQRVFVIGKRASEVAFNGRRYSRSLQANTLYYYRLFCTTGELQGKFRTANIPLGVSYSDPLPSDPANPGRYAWPWLDPNDQNQTIVDPQTGIALRRATRPQEVTANLATQAFSTAFAVGGWANASSVLADDAQSAQYSGNNSDWLYVRAPALTFENGVQSLDYFRILLKGSSVASSTANRTIQVCLTLDGATCASAIKDQALTNSMATYTIGDTTSMLGFWSIDGNAPLGTDDIRPKTGTADYDPSTHTVSRLSGQYFDTRWAAGSRITLAGTEYTISSVNGPNTMVLFGGPGGNLSGATWNFSQFGILLRKMTSSSDQVTIQWAGYSLGASYQMGWTPGSFFDLCNQNQVSVGGEPGYYCYLLDVTGVSNMYWLGTKGGKRFLGRVWASYDPANELDGLRACSPIPDTDNPNVFWCAVSNQSGKQVLLRGAYDGSNTDIGSLTYYQTGGHFTITNLTPSAAGKDLNSLANQFNSSFPANGMFSCSLRAAQKGKLLFWCLADGQQDRIGWAMVFNPGNGQSLGAGGTGGVVALTNFHSNSGARWCQPHSLDPVGDVDAMQMTTNSFYGSGMNGHGVYRTTIGGGLSASASPCPDNPFGVTGSKCSVITVNGEPCDPDPGPGELTRSGKCSSGSEYYLQDAAPGDVFKVDTEYVRLLIKNGNNWTVERANFGPASYFNSMTSHAASSQLVAQCSARGTAVWWRYGSDPNGGQLQVNPYDSGSHRVYRPEVMIYIGSSWLNPSPVVTPLQGLYQVQRGAPTEFFNSAPKWVSSNPPFAGAIGPQDGNVFQTHVSYPQVKAPAWEKQWFLDARPLVGGSDAKMSGSFIHVSEQLYKLAAPGLLDRKKLPTFAESGGRPLKDVSSPATGDTIQTGSEDSYKYCYAEQANECRQGSVPGDLYVNAPNVMASNCFISGIDVYDNNGNIVNDICVGNNPMYAQGLAQIGMNGDANDVQGQSGRLLTNALSRYKQTYNYWNARTFSDGSWALLMTKLEGGRSEVLMAKVPPYPNTDSQYRGDFMPVAVRLKPPPDLGIATAIVEFGYAENGPGKSFFCTSRQDSCWKGNQSGKNYSFSSEDSSGKMPCTDECTILVPGIPQRILYFRAKYYDESGTEITISDLDIAAVDGSDGLVTGN